MPNHAKIKKFLRRLTLDGEFAPTDECYRAFGSMKDILSSGPVLVFMIQTNRLNYISTQVHLDSVRYLCNVNWMENFKLLCFSLAQPPQLRHGIIGNVGHYICLTPLQSLPAGYLI